MKRRERGQRRRRARLRGEHRERTQLMRIESHRVGGANADADRAIVEANLSGWLAEQRAARPDRATCVGVRPMRFASAWLIVMSSLGARLAHAAEEVLDAVDLRERRLEALGVRLERDRDPGRTT